MAESVPVRCPACRREHLYTAPPYPCECGAPVAPPLDRRAAPVAVTHRVWEEEWVTVRCGACGRQHEWPHPELDCPCGTVLRIPVPRTPAAPPAGPHPGCGAATGEDSGAGSGRHTAFGSGIGAGTDTGIGAGTDAGTGPSPGGSVSGTRGSVSGTTGSASGTTGSASGTGGTVPRAASRGGPAAERGTGADGRSEAGRGAASGAGPSGGTRTGTGRSWPSASGPAAGRARRGPLPRVAVPARRAAFRPVAIRTARDAVTAAALYLRWLGYRDVRRADQRPPSGIGLAARGLVAQVDPTVHPATPRDVECLWLTAMTESARCVYFSLAGYEDEARSRADALRVALFVLDLTGTPQPVNGSAGELLAPGA